MYNKIMKLVEYTEKTNKKLLDIAISLKHITGLSEKDINEICYNENDLEEIKIFIEEKINDSKI